MQHGIRAWHLLSPSVGYWRLPMCMSWLLTPSNEYELAIDACQKWLCLHSQHQHHVTCMWFSCSLQYLQNCIMQLYYGIVSIFWTQHVPIGSKVPLVPIYAVLRSANALTSWPDPCYRKLQIQYIMDWKVRCNDQESVVETSSCQITVHIIR